MSLPPLPELGFKALTTGGGWKQGHDGYRAEQMTAYGRACWNAAIEAASKDMEAAPEWYGCPDADRQQRSANNMKRVCAGIIRALKLT
jgi:hypothetical protein